jgi:hypothetical protein
VDQFNIAGTANPQRPAVACAKSNRGQSPVFGNGLREIAKIGSLTPVFGNCSDDIFSPENVFIPKKVIAGSSAISLFSIFSSKSDFLESHKTARREFAQFPAIRRISAPGPAIANP